MKTFKLSGNFKLGSQIREFNKEVSAETDEQAREKLLSIFGSKHRLPRRFINVLQVVESGLQESIALNNDKPNKTTN